MINKPIGGYFELELPSHREWHADAIALNSGRFCLEYILKSRKYTKIFVPYYTCDSAVEPVEKLGIPYEFYHIDESYRIVEDIIIQDHQALLYTNYWGLQDEYCIELSKKYGSQLILDYTQAFYAQPISGIDTFYSCRKFFGVSDGGYLYTSKKLVENLEQDESYTRMTSLLKRLDLSPEAGFADFRKCSEEFHKVPMRYMSKLTKRIMSSINYKDIAYRRRANYEVLRSYFGGKLLMSEEVPMIFPYVVNDGQELRKYLIQNKVFVAKYWPNVEVWAGGDSLEAKMANNTIPLPIDQRYTIDDMMCIVKLIQDYE